MKSLDLAIEFNNVNLTYNNNFTVLEGISFKIPHPCCCLLLGQTGSGKSTVLSIIKGVIPYINRQSLTGSINILSNPLEESTFYEITKQIGFLTQEPEILTLESTIEYDIAFTLENLGYNTSQIKENLASLEKKYPLIKKYLNQSPNKLSAGEITLFQLIISNLANPDLILYDEPLSVLDQIQKLSFIKTIKELVRKKTIVISTHELELLLPIADYIIVLDKSSKSITFEGYKEKFLDEMKKFPWLDIPIEYSIEV